MTITIIIGTRAGDAWATVSCRAWTLPLSPHYSRSISHIPSGFHLSAFLPLLALLLHHIEPLTTSPDLATTGQVDSTSRKILCKVLLVEDRMSKWVALIMLKYWSNSSNIWCSINYNPSCTAHCILFTQLSVVYQSNISRRTCGSCAPDTLSSLAMCNMGYFVLQMWNMGYFVLRMAQA